MEGTRLALPLERVAGGKTKALEETSTLGKKKQ
jgi:hypothetical protein